MKEDKDFEISAVARKKAGSRSTEHEGKKVMGRPWEMTSGEGF
jgi:hypothetical protein